MDDAAFLAPNKLDLTFLRSRNATQPVTFSQVNPKENPTMRIRKLAIAALIAATPTATAFAQSALEQSVPRVQTRRPRHA